MAKDATNAKAGKKKETVKAGKKEDVPVITVGKRVKVACHERDFRISSDAVTAFNNFCFAALKKAMLRATGNKRKSLRSCDF